MSIVILLDKIHNIKLYHHIIIFDQPDLALNIFFHKDQVIFSTSSSAPISIHQLYIFSNKSFDSDLTVEITKHILSLT